MSKKKENEIKKDKEKEPVKIKSPKLLLIESGIKIINKIPDIVPLMVTAALTELVKIQVRRKFN